MRHVCRALGGHLLPPPPRRAPRPESGLPAGQGRARRGLAAGPGAGASRSCALRARSRRSRGRAGPQCARSRRRGGSGPRAPGRPHAPRLLLANIFVELVLVREASAGHRGGHGGDGRARRALCCARAAATPTPARGHGGDTGAGAGDTSARGAGWGPGWAASAREMRALRSRQERAAHLRAGSAGAAATAPRPPRPPPLHMHPRPGLCTRTLARTRARTHVCPAHKSYTPGAQGHAHRHRRCGSRLLYALLATHGGQRTLHPTPLPWRPTLPERKRGFGPRGVGAVCHPGQGLLLTPRATAPGPAHTAVLSPGNAAQESPRPKGAPGTQAER